ncbi:hypothetical protein B0H13DRAFT_2071406, partial [Mycena leptocephala]
MCEGSSIFFFAFSFMLCSSMCCCLWHRCPRQGRSSFRRPPLTRPSNVLASIVQVLRFRRANSIIVPGKRKGSARLPAFWKEC